jgi:hypothetical protein
VKVLVDKIALKNTAVNVPPAVSTTICWCNFEVCTGVPERKESGFEKLAGALLR